MSKYRFMNDPREWAEYQGMIRGDHVEQEANFAKELELA